MTEFLWRSVGWLGMAVLVLIFAAGFVGLFVDLPEDFIHHDPEKDEP